MIVIKTEELNKVYTRFKKEEGLKGSIKSLFRREFIEKKAVCDFQLEIDEGEFVGLIGPNGAGKTTLMKMLTGIISPSSGRISVLGYVPNELKNAYKKQFAIVMGQKSQLFQDLSAADTFLLLKEIYDIPETGYRKSLDYLTELFAVQEYLNVQVRTLSLGERMKMELIAALLHGPKILFLDEPTIGLDAVAQKQIRGFLREVNRDRGTTILLTSHYMADVVALCERIIIIHHGQLKYDGPISALSRRIAPFKRIGVKLGDPCPCDLSQYGTPVSNGSEEHEGQMSYVQVPAADVAKITARMLADLPIHDLTIEDPPIESVIERAFQE